MQGAITAGFLTLACLVLLEAPPRVSNFFKNSQKNKIFSLFQGNKEDKLKASKIAGELADKNKIKRCENISIIDTTFIYGSCPNNTYLRQPGPDYPSIIPTTSCTDSVGGRIDCINGQRVFKRDNYHTYLIGDSFIQADEIDYAKSVYGLINSSKTSPYRKAYGFGYSSWNTRQYLQAIKAINKKNSNYDIYLFANDFTPRYERSTYGEVNPETGEDNLETSTAKTDYLIEVKRLLKRSVTVRKILSLRSKVKTANLLKKLRKQRDDYWAYHKNISFDQCPSSKTQKNIDSFSPLMRDYICLLYTSPSPRDVEESRMPSSA